MNPEIKAEWVAALRSGEYAKTTGELHDDVGYCCLGVLCDLHRQKHGGQWEDGYYLGEFDILPAEVMDWAGLDSQSPAVDDDGLADLNDGAGHWQEHSFVEIADLIETYL